MDTSNSDALVTESEFFLVKSILDVLDGENRFQACQRDLVERMLEEIRRLRRKAGEADLSLIAEDLGNDDPWSLADIYRATADPVLTLILIVMLQLFTENREPGYEQMFDVREVALLANIPVAVVIGYRDLLIDAGFQMTGQQPTEGPQAVA